jgi:hypothetical protein
VRRTPYALDVGTGMPVAAGEERDRDSKRVAKRMHAVPNCVEGLEKPAAGRTERTTTSSTSSARSFWSRLGLAGVQYGVLRLGWTATRGRENALLKENCAPDVGFDLFIDTFRRVGSTTVAGRVDVAATACEHLPRRRPEHPVRRRWLSPARLNEALPLKEKMGCTA